MDKQEELTINYIQMVDTLNRFCNTDDIVELVSEYQYLGYHIQNIFELKVSLIADSFNKKE